MLLHIANTNFEWELEQQEIPDLHSSLHTHPIFLQLQFLPCLYGNPGDAIGVTAFPPDAYINAMKQQGYPTLSYHLLAQPLLSKQQVTSWGASRAVASWAKQHGLFYAMPKWDVVRRVNSKAFSFEQCTPLDGAQLLTGKQDAELWLSLQKRPFVLKTCFGFSGKGHLIIDPSSSYDPQKITRFLEKEWKRGLPVIGEPWVERVLDFSTQWEISASGSIDYLGVTRCFSTKTGTYSKTMIGDPKRLFGSYLPQVEEHSMIARATLENMQQLGYFGHVGFDAMIYENDRLHPIVEINARKTMGWVALMLQQKRAPGKLLRMEYQTSPGEGLLPQTLGADVTFPRQLILICED